MAWNKARFADCASEAAMLVCCGGLTCFEGRGCDTAKWWTQRMEEEDYRLVRKPHVVKPEDG